MTGELADCFVDRARGVEHIVSHACEAASASGSSQVCVLRDGRPISATAERASGDVDLVAVGQLACFGQFVAGEIRPTRH